MNTTTRAASSPASLRIFYLVCCYTPNSQNELRRLDYRMRWEDDFRAYLKKLDEKKPVVLCGDLNVAHEEIDLKNPKTNHFNAGFTDQERGKFSELLGAGFIDTFRYFYPDRTGAYSWWSYIGGARSRNAGWRIDYFVVSQRLKNASSPRPSTTRSWAATIARWNWCSNRRNWTNFMALEVPA